MQLLHIKIEKKLTEEDKLILHSICTAYTDCGIFSTLLNTYSRIATERLEAIKTATDI